MAQDILSYSITSNAGMCTKNRAFDFEVKTTNRRSTTVRKRIILDCIRAALVYNERRSQYIMGYLNSYYPTLDVPVSEGGFVNFQQRQQTLAWDHKRVMRYLNNETRVPTYLEGGQVDMGGILTAVHPDLVFCDDQHQAIELVRLEIGKPYLTNGGKKNEHIKNLKLLPLILYGRQLPEYECNGKMLKYQHITASVYYLEKNTDINNGIAGQNFDPDFFASGGNVVSIVDNYVGTPTEIDTIVKETVDVYNKGIEPSAMREEDCQKCPNYDICQYQMAPVVLQEELGIVKNIKDVHLTPAQQATVEITEGIWVINAGAGSGKTFTIVMRVINLLNNGVLPSEIFMCTFTNAAAKEMRERIHLAYEAFGTVPNLDIEEIVICTFNAFGDLVIGDTFPYLKFTKKPKVIDNVEKFSIIADLMNQNPIPEWTGDSFLHFDSTKKNAKGALQIVSDIFEIVKSLNKPITSITPGDVSAATMDCDIPTSAVAAVINMYPKFDAQLKARNLIEYIDQDVMPFQIFDMIPDYLQNRFQFKHLIVDEFQDSNPRQVELLVHLMDDIPTFKSLMVVGDDSQAIYGFRGGEPDVIINLENYLGREVQHINLVENHRSTPQIINFANGINALNQNRVDKDLVATRDDGKPVTAQWFYTKDDEYKFILNGVKDHLADGVRPEAIAVIAYTKAELQALADMFSKNNIPTVMAAPERLMSNSRIRAILAFGRVLCDPNDTKDALICANALVGGMVMELPKQRIQQLMDNIMTRVTTILNAASLQAKKEGFMAYIDAIAMDDETVENFKEGLANKDFGEILKYCADFALYGGDVEYRRVNNYPGVVLTTAHSSKGLEWPVVYNTLSRYQSGSKVYEETRRLVFVSATRARDELYISGVAASYGKTYKNRIFNKYLQECVELLGGNFDPHYAK